MIKLFDYLIKYGGEIVSSNSLTTEDINQARASERMYVDENSFGFVWMPPVEKFPETEEEVSLFEKWFPLPVELPEHLKDSSVLFDKIEKKKKQEITEREIYEALKTKYESHPEQGEQGSDQEFLQMQFPGKGGSDIHKPSEEQELEEIKNTLKISPRQGEQGELYKWVKASERLPIRRQKSSVKLYHGGISLKVRDREATGFFVSFDDKIFCDYKIHESDSTGGCGTIPEDRFYEIEWLCKLSSPPPEGQDETNKWLRRCDAVLNGDTMKEQITAKELYEQLSKMFTTK